MRYEDLPDCEAATHMIVDEYFQNTINFKEEVKRHLHHINNAAPKTEMLVVMSMVNVLISNRMQATPQKANESNE